MAAIPYFIISPTAILALISLMKGGDETPTVSSEDLDNTSLDVVIPTYNEELNIAFCLSSLETQTYKIRKVFIYDDMSTDRTVEFAQSYMKGSSLNIEIIKRTKHTGKTPSMYESACGDATFIMVLDADTFLLTPNYIELLMKEFLNPSVASVSGRVYPLHEKDFNNFVKENPRLEKFYRKHPDANYISRLNWWQRISKGITNIYRDTLYLYLGEFIYRGLNEFCGSIPNTVGCAAIYRRNRLKAVFDKYVPTLGFNFTAAEDTFIGFEFIDNGYRNSVISEAIAKTQEPFFYRLPKQVFIWTSGFLQTCYYFGHVYSTLWRRIKATFKKTSVPKEILDKRKYSEPYRQPWGTEYSKAFGRPINLYIATMSMEKILFPLFLIFIIYFQNWFALLTTAIAELLLISCIVCYTSKSGRRLINVGKTIFITPLRYFLLLFDTVIVANFVKDLVFGSKGTWRK